MQATSAERPDQPSGLSKREFEIWKKMIIFDETDLSKNRDYDQSPEVVKFRTKFLKRYNIFKTAKSPLGTEAQLLQFLNKDHSNLPSKIFEVLFNVQEDDQAPRLSSAFFVADTDGSQLSLVDPASPLGKEIELRLHDPIQSDGTPSPESNKLTSEDAKTDIELLYGMSYEKFPQALVGQYHTPETNNTLTSTFDIATGSAPKEVKEKHFTTDYDVRVWCLRTDHNDRPWVGGDEKNNQLLKMAKWWREETIIPEIQTLNATKEFEIWRKRIIFNTESLPLTRGPKPPKEPEKPSIYIKVFQDFFIDRYNKMKAATPLQSGCQLRSLLRDEWNNSNLPTIIIEVIAEGEKDGQKFQFASGFFTPGESVSKIRLIDPETPLAKEIELRLYDERQHESNTLGTESMLFHEGTCTESKLYLKGTSKLYKGDTYFNHPTLNPTLIGQYYQSSRDRQCYLATSKYMEPFTIATRSAPQESKGKNVITSYTAQVWEMCRRGSFEWSEVEEKENEILLQKVKSWRETEAIRPEVKKFNELMSE